MNKFLFSYEICEGIEVGSRYPEKIIKKYYKLITAPDIKTAVEVLKERVFGGMIYATAVDAIKTIKSENINQFIGQ